MTGSEHFAVEVADGRYVRVITAGPPDGLALVFHTGTLRRTRCPAMAISRSSHTGIGEILHDLARLAATALSA